ncbi:hypothetical protein EIP86_001033 [Pleurotus ostreatoroseus]|nr:hypothetical protein EIP86_001033 [Pleurotus ostreatoroseus]
MEDVASAISTSHALEAARTSVSAAYQLLRTTTFRRKQLELLTDRCNGMLQQYASLIKDSMIAQEVFSDGHEAIEESCQSVKTILEVVNEKGFLWCLMSPDRIDIELNTCEQKLETASHIVDDLTAQDRAQKFTHARRQDRKALSKSLTELSENEDGLLEALQDANGVYRSPEEVLVAVIKHVKNLPQTQDNRPETVFFKNAAKLLGPKHGKSGTDALVDSYVLTSIEVEVDYSHSIGRGASGEVFKGEWNGAPVAVKRMHIDDAKFISDKQRRNAIRREVKIWSALHHPNVLTFYGACLEADVPFVVMRSGQDNAGGYAIVPHCRSQSQSLRSQSQEITFGLSFLHSQGIVHADVKGANVLIGDDHHALISDFGLALKLHQIRTRSTYSGDLVSRRGTPLWMAPEVLQGDDPGMAADVYSLGLTIWERMGRSSDPRSDLPRIAKQQQPLPFNALDSMPLHGAQVTSPLVPSMDGKVNSTTILDPGIFSYAPMTPPATAEAITPRPYLDSQPTTSTEDMASTTFAREQPATTGPRLPNRTIVQNLEPHELPYTSKRRSKSSTTSKGKLPDNASLPFADDDNAFVSDDDSIHTHGQRRRSSEPMGVPVIWGSTLAITDAKYSNQSHGSSVQDLDSSHHESLSSRPLELSWDLDKFFAATGLRDSFKIRERFLRTLMNRATSVSRDKGHHSLTSPESIKRLVRLALYQPVIYCDDSSSMGDNDLFAVQRDLVGQIVRITSKHRLYNGNAGVELRFVNAATASRVSNGDQFQQAWQRVRPRGGNKIGTGLRDKVLGPLVFQVLESKERLERPLLVNIVTDYCPDTEARSTLRDAILECKQKLVAGGYKATDVLYTISSITNDLSAAEFLDELRRDSQLSDVLSCTAECFQDVISNTLSDERKLQEWVLQAVTTPIMRLETAYLFLLSYLTSVSTSHATPTPSSL